MSDSERLMEDLERISRRLGPELSDLIAEGECIPEVATTAVVLAWHLVAAAVDEDAADFCVQEAVQFARAPGVRVVADKTTFH